MGAVAEMLRQALVAARGKADKEDTPKVAWCDPEIEGRQAGRRSAEVFRQALEAGN